MKKYKYIFFDVANTLLHKPQLIDNIYNILNSNGYTTNKDLIATNHRLLSEALTSPSKPDKGYYEMFNSEVLYSLGIIPTKSLLFEIYELCRKIKWERFEDTKYLEDISTQMGIISNWDNSLNTVIDEKFPDFFSTVVSSSQERVSKPDSAIFIRALQKIGLEAQDVLYIGNSIKLDIHSAMKVGMLTCLIDRENRYPNYSGLRIRSFEDLIKIGK